MKIKLYSIAFSLIFFSCSSEENTAVTEPIVVEQITTPIITSITKDFLIEEETLIIEGTDFINSKYKTQVIINDKPYEVNPLSNNQITIKTTNLMGIEKSTVAVTVGDKTSETKAFFIVPKGWYKVDTNLEIIKAFVFDDTNTLNVFIDTQPSDNSFFGDTRRLIGNSNGYVAQTTSMSGLLRNDFLMFDKNVGVAMDPNAGYFTSNAFEEFQSFGSFIANGKYALPGYITYIDATSSIITDYRGVHIFTADKGKTSKSANASMQLFGADHYRGKAFGKGSDNYFYEIGYNVGSQQTTNCVIKSLNGFDNWELVYNEGNFNLGIGTYFYDFDLLFTKSYTNELLSSNNLGRTWNVRKSNIQSFFIKNRASWYIVSDDKLYFTGDSGQNWSLELELPADSTVNYMSFSPNKTVLAGKNLLYINHL
ncbi:MAG: IPT/TIG domain-containing protein [Flavobacterium sp.]|nr:IPT/TIG domain-containing protein [Flavobacterium sp.]